jgi:hypothetical protein
MAAARIQNAADWALIEASWNSVPTDQANPLYAGIYRLGVLITFPVQTFFRGLEIKQMEGATAIDRRSSIIGDDDGMQARYDNPQYDFQTADGRGITRAYVDAYASGDLKTAAQLLVRAGGGNIYPDPADGFYPDAILRRQAGYEGGVGSSSNGSMDDARRAAMGWGYGNSNSNGNVDDARRAAMGWGNNTSNGNGSSNSSNSNSNGNVDDARRGAMGWETAIPIATRIAATATPTTAHATIAPQTILTATTPTGTATTGMSNPSSSTWTAMASRSPSSRTRRNSRPGRTG